MLPADRSAVRVVVDNNRPGVAINIEMLDEAGKVIDVVTEVIFKRYSLDSETKGEGKGDGAKGKMHENNFDTALYNMSATEISYSSFLYSTGGMTDKAMEAVRDLLEGKTIKPIYNYKADLTYIRMQKKV